MNIEYIPEEYKTKEMCEHALNENIELTQHIPKYFLTINDYLGAINKNPVLLCSINSELAFPREATTGVNKHIASLIVLG